MLDFSASLVTVFSTQGFSAASWHAVFFICLSKLFRCSGLYTATWQVSFVSASLDIVFATLCFSAATWHVGFTLPLKMLCCSEFSCCLLTCCCFISAFLDIVVSAPAFWHAGFFFASLNVVAVWGFHAASWHVG